MKRIKKIKTKSYFQHANQEKMIVDKVNEIIDELNKRYSTHITKNVINEKVT